MIFSCTFIASIPIELLSPPTSYILLSLSLLLSCPLFLSLLSSPSHFFSSIPCSFLSSPLTSSLLSLVPPSPLLSLLLFYPLLLLSLVPLNPLSTSILLLSTSSSSILSFFHLPLLPFVIFLHPSPFSRRITIDEERLVLAFETLDVESKGHFYTVITSSTVLFCSILQYSTRH